MKKIILTTAVLLVMSGSNVYADDDTGFMSKLIKENHQLKNDINNIEMKNQQKELQIQVLNKKLSQAEAKLSQYKKIQTQVKNYVTNMDENLSKLKFSILKKDKTKKNITPALNNQKELEHKKLTAEKRGVKYKSLKLNDYLIGMVKNKANVRNAPSINGKIIKTLLKGDFVILTHKSKDGMWYKIKNKNLWIYKNVLTIK